VAAVLGISCNSHVSNGAISGTNLQGTHGSAKSTHARIIKNLIDPGDPPLSSAPRDERDLMIMANNSLVISFDNMSGISNRISDIICRLSTGAGFTTRKLYTDNEETIFCCARPMILNGIDSLATRPDLADRALIINLPAISEDKRRTETEMRKIWDEVSPRVFGALLDALVESLRIKEQVQLPKLPRMADFFIRATAAEKALRLPTGAVYSAYEDNREDAIQTTLEADPVAMTIIAFMKEKKVWRGTASELLSTLTCYCELKNGFSLAKDWPRTPNMLSNRIGRAQPSLETSGIKISKGTANQQRFIELSLQP